MGSLEAGSIRAKQASPTAAGSAWVTKRALALLGAAISLTASAAALGPGAASAATTIFNPVADAYVYSPSPTKNFGSADTVRANADPAKTVYGYLRFDVQGLNDPVTGAVLRLFTGSSLSGSGLSLRSVPDNTWNENTINYANRPAFGPPLTDSGSATTGQWISIDAASLVQGNGTLSVALTTAVTGNRLVSSREVAGQAPQLVVQTASSSDRMVAAAGDIACDPSASDFNAGLGTATTCRQLYTSNLLLNPNLSAILPLGDNQYEKGTLASYMASYNPSWGRVKALTRPAVGNHEYSTSGASGYFDYFDGVGSSTGPAGDRRKGYYSYDIGNWHLISLNSNCTKVGGCDPGTPQELWLKADLAAHPASCVLAYWHHPRFSSGTSVTATSAFWQDLYAAGADIVLSGHDHIYERFARQDPAGLADPTTGIREFIVGTGGRSHGSASNVKANSGMRNTKTFGVLDLNLRPDGYDWRFVPEQGAKFTDLGSNTCNGATVDTEPPTLPTSLTASAGGPDRVKLSWKASLDNDGVAGYRIARNGVDVASSPTAGTTTVPYVDAGLQPNTTYTYRLTAYDSLGNVSVPSSTVTVTTPAG
jgi:fibronectin type III domain protein/calcineurin-like phosphoesterase family protein